MTKLSIITINYNNAAGLKKPWKAYWLRLQKTLSKLLLMEPAPIVVWKSFNS